MQPPDPTRRPLPSPLPGRGRLARAVRERARSALAAGALEPIRTRCEIVEDAGVAFAVRVLEGGDPKRGAPAPAAGAAASPNPFLPYDPALFVADVSETHVCLLNKFPALEGHVLLVTRRYEEQTAPLGREDFEALWTCLLEIDGLGFYNAGPIAGASQRHRHLQLVDAPLRAGARRAPIEALLEEARFDARLGAVPGLPFLHAFARLRACEAQPAPDAAGTLHALYSEMLRAFGCERDGQPYNLLATRDWMLLVPRTREAWQSIPVNALGFAGCLLVRDAGELARLRELRPMQLLRRVAVARD